MGADGEVGKVEGKSCHAGGVAGRRGRVGGRGLESEGLFFGRELARDSVYLV